eukprot:5767-Prymnesium_polylepis.1
MWSANSESWDSCSFPPRQGRRGFVTAHWDKRLILRLTAHEDESEDESEDERVILHADKKHNIRSFFNWDQPRLLPPPPPPPPEPAPTPQPPPPPPPERMPTPEIATDDDDDDGDRDPCKVKGLRALLEETVVDELIVNEKLVAAMAFCSAEGAHSVADIIEFELGEGFVAALEPLRRVPKKKLLKALQVIIMWKSCGKRVESVWKACGSHVMRTCRAKKKSCSIVW